MIESRNDEALICKAAVSLLGEEALLRMSIEECSELTAKICRFLRRQYRPELISKADLAEEVADVQIMMDQLREMDDREIERGCRKFRPDYSVAELEMWFAAEEKQQRLSLVEGKDGI